MFGFFVVASSLAKRNGLIDINSFRKKLTKRSSFLFKFQYNKLKSVPMDTDMKKYLEDFVELCYSRLEKGDKERHNDFMILDLYQEMMEELSDIANYAFLE